MNSELISLEPLNDADYLEGHLLFKRSSTQQEKMLKWLNGYFLRTFDTSHCSILGIGSGAGVVDLPLLQSLAPHIKNIHYVGIDPNSASCERFREQLKTWHDDPYDISIHCTPLDSFNGEILFDVALMVHVMYYFQNLGMAIQDALQNLKVGGQLLILHAPDDPLQFYSKISTRQLYGHPMWLSPDIERELQKQNIAYECSRISAEVKVTPLFSHNDPMKYVWLNFIVQGDARNLPNHKILKILKQLQEISYEREGDIYIDHPIDAIVVTK